MERNKLDKMIKNLGDEFSYKFPGLRRYLKPLYHKIFKDRYYSKRRDAFLSESYDVIERFDRSLSKAGIQYSLGFGSMLGAVREHGIIGHDADMDTLVWAEGDNFKLVKESLEKAGFVRTRCFLIENGKLGREETYEFNSVPIDIFYIYPPVEELPYTAYFIPVEGYRTPRISMKEVGKMVAGGTAAGIAESAIDQAITNTVPTRAAVHQKVSDAARSVPVLGDAIDAGQKASYLGHL